MQSINILKSQNFLIDIFLQSLNSCTAYEPHNQAVHGATREIATQLNGIVIERDVVHCAADNIQRVLCVAVWPVEGEYGMHYLKIQ